MKILQVNSTDGRGGAAEVAGSLHRAYRARGHNAWQIVGHKTGQDQFTLPMRHDLNAALWQRPFWRAEDWIAKRRFRGARWLRTIMRMAAHPQHFIDWYRGYEPNQFPGTKNLLKTSPIDPDILHLHNLHGHYFNLSQLPFLSSQVPTLISLHDAWLLSGHCSFSFDCRRWQGGCGQCPDLTIPPAVRRDATAENWQRKKEIFSNSRYCIITPSKWLADKVQNSILAAGLANLKIIPHGIDLEVFKPGSQQKARHVIGLADNQPIILMVANGFRDNPWKDIELAYSAFENIAGTAPERQITILAVGDNLPVKQIGNIEIRFLPYIHDKKILAQYYRAANILLSTSKIEVWGLAISESLACGTPVIAPQIGGIPDQITSWPHERANGILTQPGDAAAIARAIMRLLDDSALLNELGQNAAQFAKESLDFEIQVNNTLDYYQQIIARWEQ